MSIKSWFPTQVYFEKLQANTAAQNKLNKQLLIEAQDLRNLDSAGKSWSKENYLNGFTSYASVNDLPARSPSFEHLEKLIDQHVQKYVRALEFDLGGKKLKMNSCWINVMNKNTHHGMHIHPLSVISGTYYVLAPKDASVLKFEDPRLSKFMGAPPRKQNCKNKNRQFVSYVPRAGNVVLFESWLRHEVPQSSIASERISVSFNYDWI